MSAEAALEIKSLVRRPLSPFISFIWKFRDRSATDPQDKVYSLLGLLGMIQPRRSTESSGAVEALSEFDVNDLIIDYGAPVEVVYASLVRAMVITTKSLNIICACQSSSSFSRSWGLDWAEPWSRFSLLTNNIFPRKTEVESGYQATRLSTTAVQFLQDLSRMKTKGLVWSTISLIVLPPPSMAECGALAMLKSLDAAVRAKLDAVYSIYGPDHPAEASVTACKWISVPLRGYTQASREESLGLTSWTFFPGASDEWHEIVAKTARISKDGRE